MNERNTMFKAIETLLTNIISAGSNYYFISNRNAPIRQYCQTEFKDEWKTKYYELTGKQL